MRVYMTRPPTPAGYGKAHLYRDCSSLFRQTVRAPWQGEARTPTNGNTSWRWTNGRISWRWNILIDHDNLKTRTSLCCTCLGRACRDGYVRAPPVSPHGARVKPWDTPDPVVLDPPVYLGHDNQEGLSLAVTGHSSDVLAALVPLAHRTLRQLLAGTSDPRRDALLTIHDDYAALRTTPPDPEPVWTDWARRIAAESIRLHMAIYPAMERLGSVPFTEGQGTGCLLLHSLRSLQPEEAVASRYDIDLSVEIDALNRQARASALQIHIEHCIRMALLLLQARHRPLEDVRLPPVPAGPKSP